MDTQTKDFLESLAEKLGVTVDKVYQAMLKQVKIDVLKDLVATVLLLILALIIYHLWKVWLPYDVPINPTAASYDQDYPDSVVISGVVLGVFTIANLVILIPTICSLYSNGIDAIFNPEGAAIQKIINLKS